MPIVEGYLDAVMLEALGVTRGPASRSRRRSSASVASDAAAGRRWGAPPWDSRRIGEATITPSLEMSVGDGQGRVRSSSSGR